MKVLYINVVSYGSTGRIMFALADETRKEGGTTLCTAGFTWSKKPRDDFFITSGLVEKKLHTELSKITGKHGGYSRFSTLRLISRIKKFDPDIIHLHNIHGWFLNLKMLFDYLKKSKKKVVWTLHDCWSFTGGCPHFEGVGCEKWKTGCFECSYKGYPETYFDFSKREYLRKKQLFCNVENLYIVTPSEWLKTKVKESFLKDYPVKVINNGINLTAFYPRDDIEKTEIRKKYGINTKYMVLGVSYAWDEKKGLNAFVELSETLGEEYTVVLVGTDENVEKNLTGRIIPIRRTENVDELSRLYSAADVFVNPTLEDTFPTVNIEALACGTPIAAFDTGGSAEIFCEKSGMSVKKGDVLALIDAVKRICEEKIFSENDCKLRSERFSEGIFLKKYMDFYREII